MPARLAIILVIVFLMLGNDRATAKQDATEKPSSDLALPLSVTSQAPVCLVPNNDSSDPGAPIATLLGKKVYRRDCFSHSWGIGSFDTGIKRLILVVLTEDFCQVHTWRLSQQEIDAYQQALDYGASRNNVKMIAYPPFDESKIQSKLDEVQKELSSIDTPWLERLALQRSEREYIFALAHKSEMALRAYQDLWPVRCDNALYHKYGGKVIQMQISIAPIGAYIKLIQEAEDSGKLQFHDETVKQVFLKEMNKYLERREIEPERVQFSMPFLLQLWLKEPNSFDRKNKH